MTKVPHKAAVACCMSVSDRKFLSKCCSVCFELELVKAPEMYQTAIKNIVNGEMKAMAPWTGPPAPGHTPESPAPLKIPDGGRLKATPLGSGPGSGAFGSSFHGWSSDSVLYVLQWNCDDFVAADGTKVKPLTSHTGTKERKDGRDWMAIKPTKLFPKAILSDEALLLGLILVGVESLDSRIPVPLRPSLGLTHMQALRLSAKRDSSRRRGVSYRR